MPAPRKGEIISLVGGYDCEGPMLSTAGGTKWSARYAEGATASASIFRFLDLCLCSKRMAVAMAKSKTKPPRRPPIMTPYGKGIDDPAMVEDEP